MSAWDIAKDVALIITPIVIGLGFFFAHRQLVSNRNTRMAEIVLAITTRWDSAEMHASRSKLNQMGSKLWETLKAADTENTEDFYILLRVADFFDAIGLLVMEGFLSRKMAYDLFGAAEEHYYNLYRPTIDEHRFKSSFISFQRLHETFKKEAARRSGEEPRRPV
ncbi:hypothetical protein ES703_81997 [subsurface metagenome]